MNLKLVVRGNKEAIKGLNNIPKRFRDEFNELIVIASDNIMEKAQMRANPYVDTGFLKNSIYKVQSDFYAEVGARVHYAPYVEFGTGGMVDVPNGLEFYASQFKGAGVKQVNLPPRPFLFNSAFEETREIIRSIAEINVLSS